MASQVTARHICPVKQLNPIDSLHKMNQMQHEGLLKRMYMPFVRGPEDRHSFTSFQDKYSNAFLKSNPFISPEDKYYILAPHRDDVPVSNTFSGFVSPGAKAEQQIKYGRPVGDGRDQQPPEWAPLPFRRVQTADGRSSLRLDEIKQDQQWNSTAVPDISIRTKIGGWTSPVKVIPAPPQTKECFSPHAFAFHVDPNVKSSDPSFEACRDARAQKYMYTSTTQRGYEDVPWDRMLPPKPKAPDSTLERMPDCVSQCFTMKRYDPIPHIGQVVGGLWDRFQKRSFTSPHRPINFVSPCSRTQQLPSYTGCVGAENAEDLDDPDADVIIHGRVRLAKPRYVNSSHSPNTFGYTGKVHWSAIQPVNSNLPPTSPSIISRMYGCIAKHGHPSEFPHRGALSQILTPTEPQNPFNKKERVRVKI